VGDGSGGRNELKEFEEDIATLTKQTNNDCFQDVWHVTTSLWALGKQQQVR